MRIVLDTNVFISGLLTPGGVPASLVRRWIDGRFILVSHERQLEELRATTRRDPIQTRLPHGHAGRLVNEIKAYAQFPSKLPAVERSRDPKDDFLLALCDAGRVDRLVTGDKDDLLALERHGSTLIVSVAASAQEIG